MIRSVRSAPGHSLFSDRGQAVMQDLRKMRFARPAEVEKFCLLDLEYGLPVQRYCTVINSNDAIPKSDVNREYFAEEHDRKARAVIDYESSFGKACPNDTILKLQRTTP
ncbi:LOW QUALITY PROTEIN: hypothetical protein RJ641_032804 [Dillenia turbinata]|uniref:Uncharacterized protein n=1 Tax=Dillenia turbinata TaxID=194707 RepID=A0AAN8ZCS4_9MAGN